GTVGGQFLLPAPGIVEAFSEDGFNIEIDNDQIFLKLLSSCNEIAVLIKHQAIAIKYEFILTADKVVIRNDDCIVSSASGEHCFAPATLAGVIRRGRDVDNHLRSARQRLLEHRPIGIPNIFTNADSECCPIHLKHGTATARLEISKFVEHAVIR